MRTEHFKYYETLMKDDVVKSKSHLMQVAAGTMYEFDDYWRKKYPLDEFAKREDENPDIWQVLNEYGTACSIIIELMKRLGWKEELDDLAKEMDNNDFIL